MWANSHVEGGLMYRSAQCVCVNMIGVAFSDAFLCNYTDIQVVSLLLCTAT